MSQSVTSLGTSPWTVALPGSTFVPLRWCSGSAWVISSVVHGLLIAVGLWSGTHVVATPRPPIRLVFVEPPPPPPAPAPTAVAATPMPTVEHPPTVEKKPQPRVQPKRQAPKRPTIVKHKIVQPSPKPIPLKPITPPQPEVVGDPTPEPTPVTEATPIEATSTARLPTPDMNGVIGGVAGGQAGGVIGSRGTAPLPLDQVANPPLLVSRVTPDYPRPARRQGIEGLVVLEAVLTLEGDIEEEIKVLHSIPALDDAAIEAVRRWRFRPARDQDNQPVRVILEVPVRFVLR